MTPGVLAHDERGFLQADALWRHDFEGLGMLEDAVLVNAALMRERVPSDDGLVVLNRECRHARPALTGTRQHGGVDAGPVRQNIRPRLDSPYDLIQSSIARGVGPP